MILRSRSVGELRVEEDSLLYFADGVIGFEDLKRFVLAEVKEFEPFMWLISADEPEIGFAIADPGLFFEGRYEVPLGDADKDALDLQAGDTVSIFVIVSIADGGRRICANLKGPVVLNTRSRMCKQVVIYNPAYSVRQALLAPNEARPACAEAIARDRAAIRG